MLGVVDLLIAQGILGAYDVLWNHQVKERLPARAQPRCEQWLHGIREVLHAVVLLGIPWWPWDGLSAWMLAPVFLMELLLTARDFVEKDRSRRLLRTERVTQLVLSMNGGAYLTLLFPNWLKWAQEKTGLIAVAYGLRSWLLTGRGIGPFLWGLRVRHSGWRLNPRILPLRTQIPGEV